METEISRLPVPAGWIYPVTPGASVAVPAAMSHTSLRIALGGIAVALVGRPAAADHLLISAGVGESADGPALAGDVELRMGAATASARIDHGATLLVGYDLAQARRITAARWDDGCIATLRALRALQAASTSRCWDAAVHSEPRVAIDRALGGALGVRRDGDRLDAVAALRLYPTSDLLADVIELAATLPVAGRDAMYVHHARLAAGWFARAQWRLSLVRIGGEVGMTGLATRSAAGTTSADAYAIATLAVAVGL
jgi:hypothetical protein